MHNFVLHLLASELRVLDMCLNPDYLEANYDNIEDEREYVTDVKRRIVHIKGPLARKVQRSQRNGLSARKRRAAIKAVLQHGRDNARTEIVLRECYGLPVPKEDALPFLWPAIPYEMGHACVR